MSDEISKKSLTLDDLEGDRV